MSTTLSAEQYAEELISGLRNLATSRYVSVAGYAILLYDHILTLPAEVGLIWRKPKSLVSYAFLFNRYGVPLFVALDLFHMIGAAHNVPDKFCHDWLFIEGLLQIVCHGIAHWLAALRVRALHSGHPRVDIVLYISGTLYMVTTVAILFLVLVSVAKTFVWSSTLNMCFGTFPPWMYWCWVPGIIFEVILFGLIALRAVRDWKRDLGFPLTRLLYRDGLIYFVVIVACSIFNVIAWSALPSTMVALAKFFAFSLVAVMSSRIVLNLRTLRPREYDMEEVDTGTGIELGGLSVAWKSRRSVSQSAARGHQHSTDPVATTSSAPNSTWTPELE